MASCHIIKYLQSYSIQPTMQSYAVHPLKFSPMRRNSKSKLRIFETQIPSPIPTHVFSLQRFLYTPQLRNLAPSCLNNQSRLASTMNS